MKLLGPAALLFLSCTSVMAAPTDPLLDWTHWREYRATVKHPALGIKAADIERARANIRTQDWAKKYRDGVVAAVDPYLTKLTTEFLESMIPETTPLDRNYTPCPACRDQGKPLIPHGQWTWNPNQQDELRCAVCNTTFPNEKYPESVVLETKWGKPGRLTFCGGEPFTIFGKTVRPTFTGNIRARKVEWISNFVRQLAEAYALTGDPKYAVASRPILLRLSAVYPNWLVHTGYGDFADIDPKVAALAVNDLPTDELVCPPMKPDRKLATGYWTAGRASGSGIEGTFARKVTEAYDLTCAASDAAGQPVYTDAERLRIEQDLLLESTVLAVGDRVINNKSMGNRTAAALVGICTGHPELVRYGLEGFKQTVNSWFLPDGATPESAAYALMALNGTVDLPQAARGYSDPPGYADADKHRFDKLNLYDDPAFVRVWQAMFNTLQGNLRYPPLADSYRTSGIGAKYAEIMAANYPDNANYLALRQEAAADAYIDGGTAIYLRQPGENTPATAPLKFPDMLFLDLRQGYMRTGTDGRDSLLLLNASRWGTHHHRDSLNLYYWKNGKELLSDLGYLWDHPFHDMTNRSLAHNLVLIDEQNQQAKERGGEVEFFAADAHAKAMRANSKAYAQATIYERTSVLVDHGTAGSYAVDFFRVQGGQTQDYVFHGPGNDFQTDGLALAPIRTPVYDLTNVKAGAAPTGATLTWKLDPQMEFTAWMPPLAGEQYFIGDGWGQRDSKNADLGATLPYIVRRTQGPDARTFTTVFEGHAPGTPVVQSVQTLALPAAAAASALLIQTTAGTDLILSSPAGTTLKTRVLDNALETTAPLTVLSLQKKRPVWSFTSNKSEVRWNGDAF